MKNKNKIITIYFLEKLKFAGLVKLKTLQMYKDLLTTAFLRYHGSVATSSPTDQLSGEHSKDRSERTSSGRKLLGFVDSMLGATGTGLGISNWISAKELKQNELKVKSSQVTFIYIALLTIQIVSKHLTVSSWRIECQ